MIFDFCMFRSSTIFIFIVLYCVNIATAQKKDTVFIRNFSTKDFKTSSINYTGIIDKKGAVLFANENGILHYDGSEWSLITITDFGSAFSLHTAPNGVIYVGGNNEFGYLVEDENLYRYQSLRHTIADNINLDIVWQVKDAGQSIYFASYEKIIRYETGKSHIIDIDNGSIFKVGDEILVSRFDDGIYKIKEDSAYLHNDTYHWEEDNVYSSLPSLKDTNSYILYTSENGIYTYDPKVNVIEPFATSDDALIDSGWLYNGQIWNDSLYIFSTWREGFIMMDKEGEIVKTITLENGLLTDNYQDFILDSRNNIWSTSTNGISYIPYLLAGNQNTRIPLRVGP